MEENSLQSTTPENKSPQENIRDILLARAKKLAQVELSGKIEGENIEILSFRLAEEIYGIEAKYIKEVYPIREITILPSVPPFAYGLVNIRRRIYSIIDLRPLFDLPLSDRGAESRIIILKNEQMSFGLFCDQVIALQSISANTLQPQVAGLNGLRNALLKGITKDRLIVLDGNKLLNEDSLVVNQI